MTTNPKNYWNITMNDLNLFRCPNYLQCERDNCQFSHNAYTTSICPCIEKPDCIYIDCRKAHLIVSEYRAKDNEEYEEAKETLKYIRQIFEKQT